MADNRTSSSGAHAFGDRAGSTSTVHGRGADGDSEHGGLIDRVRDRAAAQLSTQKDRAIDGLGTAARAVRQSTQQLRDQQHETVAGYVEGAADQLERISQRLRDKDVGELIGDAQRLARRQPALFVGTAFAIGLVGARFLKSSRDDADEYDDYEAHPRAYGSGMNARGSSRSTGDWSGATAGAQYGANPYPASGAGTGTGSSIGASGIGTAGTGASRTGDLGPSSGGGADQTLGGRSGTKSPAASSTQGAPRGRGTESDIDRER